PTTTGRSTNGSRPCCRRSGSRRADAARSDRSDNPRSAGRRCGTPAAGTAGARAAAWHRRAHLRGVVRPPEGRSGMQPSLTAAHEHGPGAPASGAPARPPRRTVWIALLIAGVAVRLFLWWFTVGTNDVATWASHGQNVG